MDSFRVRDVDSGSVGRLAGALGIRDITARCLAARGIDDPAAAEAFMDPRLSALRAPDGLAGLREAVAGLADAAAARVRVGVFGDYDVDGVTTTALLTGYLRRLGVACVPRVARRAAGYGFGVADADALADAGCKLVITGDCGTSDTDAIRRAQGRGVSVIVVDHHTVPEGDPADHPAAALVNPLRPDSTFPFRGMASVGLAFYLMAALRTELRDRGLLAGRAAPDVRELLDLVALGTVADLVPLTRENRILTAHGLRLLAERRRPGVRALMQAAGVDGARPIDERTIAWRLGPRLNAPGRLGDATPSLALLLSPDDATGARWAEQIEQANAARREAQDRVLDEAVAAVEAASAAGGDPGPAVVVAGRGWPGGVVGIVAAKLVERYGRPAFVIAIDPETGRGVGSARSAAGVDLYAALERASDRLVRFGGHAGAAGLTLDEREVDGVREILHAAVAEQTGRRGAADRAEPSADAEVALSDVDTRLCRELEAFAPFGKGNERPLLLCRGMRVSRSKRVGDGSHLKLEVSDQRGASRSGIAFGMGALDPGAGATIDAAFAPVVSTWGGRPRVELDIVKLRA